MTEMNTMKNKKPNVVVIIADDMGYGDLRAYGGEIKAPNIERLIKTGMKFTDFHSSGSVCSPTRAGFITGCYQQRAGVEGVLKVSEKGQHDGLKGCETSLVEYMRESGYATGLFGKWHLGYSAENHPMNHGYEAFIGYVGGNIDYFSHYDQVGDYDWWNGREHAQEEGYSTHLISNHAVDFIKNHREEPFFVCVAHEAPHYPYQGPKDAAERGLGKEFETTGSRADQWQAYHEMVWAMDDGIGDILDTLDQNNLREDTLVIFFSDNGANSVGCNGILRDGKASLYEGGHRVPMVVSWPKKIQENIVNEATTISLDIMPTVLSLCHIEITKDGPIDGLDLADNFLERRAINERNLYWRFDEKRALRSGDYKMVRNSEEGPYELFDLAKDVRESEDIAKKNPELLNQMVEEWNQWNSQFE